MMTHAIVLRYLLIRHGALQLCIRLCSRTFLNVVEQTRQLKKINAIPVCQ